MPLSRSPTQQIGLVYMGLVVCSVGGRGGARESRKAMGKQRGRKSNQQKAGEKKKQDETSREAEKREKQRRRESKQEEGGKMMKKYLHKIATKRCQCYGKQEHSWSGDLQGTKDQLCKMVP